VKRLLLVYIGLLAATVFWFAAILAAPWLWSEGRLEAAALLYRAFSLVCHQMTDRSFAFHGRQFGVCSRCTSIYAGFAFGLVLYPLVRRLKATDFPPRGILLAAAAPTLVDFLLGYSGLWLNTVFSRAATGVLLGAVLAFYILPGFVSALGGSAAQRRTGGY
jgi:uncharacterized membrane protein